jgi:hypothetical protein
MAEQITLPVNGNYATHQQGIPTSPVPNAQQSSQAPDIPKDEVAWYFVERYYNTLSRSPEKLALFFNKRSQFVAGIEEEKVPVCIGQRVSLAFFRWRFRIY